MATEFNCSNQIPYKETQHSEGRWQLCTALSIILMIVPFIFSAVFYWGKHIAKFERLRVRRMVLVHVAWLVCILHAQIGPGFVMYGFTKFPCGVRSFITMTIIPLISASMVLRLLIFFFLSELSREMTQLQSEDVPEHSSESYCNRIVRGAFDLLFALYALLFPTRTKLERARVISALSFVASAKGTALVFLIILAPFLAVAIGLILQDETYLRCTGCKLAFQEVVEIIVVALLFLMFGIFAAFRVRHYPDPWELRREATLMCLGGVVMLIGFVLGVFNDPPPDVTYDHQVIIVAGFIIFAGVQTVYQVARAYVTEKSTLLVRKQVQAKRAEKRQKHKVKSVVDDSQVPSSTQTNFTDKLVLKHVLANPALAAEFETFLVSELGVESLMFLRDSEAWKRAYFDISPSARLARAKRLFNTYISPSGSFPVNIPSGQIAVIKSSIMKEGLQDCKEDVFDAAREEISDLLQIGALKRFNNSKQYKRFLEDTTLVKGREIQSTEL